MLCQLTIELSGQAGLGRLDFLQRWRMPQAFSVRPGGSPGPGFSRRQPGPLQRVLGRLNAYRSDYVGKKVVIKRGVYSGNPLLIEIGFQEVLSRYSSLCEYGAQGGSFDPTMVRHG